MSSEYDLLSPDWNALLVGSRHAWQPCCAVRSVHGRASPEATRHRGLLPVRLHAPLPRSETRILNAGARYRNRQPSPPTFSPVQSNNKVAVASASENNELGPHQDRRA